MAIRFNTTQWSALNASKIDIRLVRKQTWCHSDDEKDSLGFGHCFQYLSVNRTLNAFINREGSDTYPRHYRCTVDTYAMN